MNKLPSASSLRQLLKKFDVNAVSNTTKASFVGGSNWVNEEFNNSTSTLKRLLSDHPDAASAVEGLEKSYQRMRASYLGDQKDLVHQTVPDAKVDADLQAPEVPFDYYRKVLPWLKAEIDGLEKATKEASAKVDQEDATVGQQLADFAALSAEEYDAKYVNQPASHPLGLDYAQFLNQVNEGYAQAFGKVSENMAQFLAGADQVDAELRIFEAERKAYQEGGVRTVDEYKYHPEWEDEAEDDAFNDRWLPVNGDKETYAHSETHEQEHDKETYFKRDWVVPPGTN